MNLINSFLKQLAVNILKHKMQSVVFIIKEQKLHFMMLIEKIMNNPFAG